MKKPSLIIAVFLLFFSCEYLSLEEEKVNLEGNIRTVEVTDIKSTSAVVKGNLQIISEKNGSSLHPSLYSSGYGNSHYENGICYSTTSNPTIKERKEVGKRITGSGNTITTVTNPKNGEFTVTLTELQEYTTYFVRAYTTNTLGTFYGNEMSFITTTREPYPPKVSTLPATNITEDKVTLNGKIDDTGEPSYIEKGFIYSGTLKKPTIEDIDGINTKKRAVTNAEFYANVDGLTTGTIYYVRAYAANDNNNFVYGDSVSFKAEHSDYYILKTKNIMVQKRDIEKGFGVMFSWEEAKQKVAESRVAGYTDWRLPAMDELEIMYEKQVEIGNFEISSYNNFYWSSTPHEDNSFYDNWHWGINFNDGVPDYNGVYSYGRVRAVRTSP
ncbi:MAG: DUF1566 domain-containing protein [Prevotellaceae bacterium]|nr:DUF1566 domain-containing protein [Prevotellaceae bacterium]